jgi:ubiquinone/menaquinone biosynthesis C-methylase UbiE
MEKMWNELARHYDLMYSWKSYRNETDRILSLVRRHKTSRGKDLLDVGCGTGGHLKFLQQYFHVIGTDASESMLNIARKKFPGLTFLRQDMASLNVGRRFDVIVCLFAAIAYTRTYANLKRTLAKFSEHLVEGGVVIIDPFVHPSLFKPRHIEGLYVDRPDMKLCRLIRTSLRGNIATLDCHFLLMTKDGTKSFRDIHRLGCFSPKRVLKIMDDCGLRSRYFTKGLMPDRGLYVGVKMG